MIIEKEKVSDLEFALFLATHIDNPCKVTVGNAVYNIRGFYLREAKAVLPKIKDADARKILSDKIRQYEPSPLRLN